MGGELKPCPFCACHHITTASGQAEFEDEPDWVAACAGCHAEVRGDTEAEAITAWNTRAPTEPNPCRGIFDHKWLDAECVHSGCQSLFLAEAREALRALVFAARTSGGTAGPDEALMAACERAEAILIHPQLRAKPPIPATMDHETIPTAQTVEEGEGE